MHEHGVIVVHRHPRTGDDVIAEMAVRWDGPEWKHEVGKAPVDLARRARPIGRVHGTPVGVRHVILGRPIAERVNSEISRLGVLRLDPAHVQEAEMRGIDIAFERLQVIALALHHELIALALVLDHHRFEHRQRGRFLAFAHIGPDQAVALDRRIGLRRDPVGKGLVLGHIGHVQAVTGHVEFPAVIGATQPLTFVLAEEQRRASMRTTMVEHADPALAIAERDQLLAQEHETDGWAVDAEFGGERSGDPVFPQHLAHRGSRSDPGQQFAFRPCGHASLPLRFILAVISNCSSETRYG